MTTAFQYTVGILGHPTTPDVRWTEDRLLALKELGINTIQLSIAWAWKPANEVLNLEDFISDPAQLPEWHAESVVRYNQPGGAIYGAAHQKEWHHRVALAKKVGFHTLAHFGLPMGPPEDVTTCISDDAVVEFYQARLKWLFTEYPGIDDVMVYTYDQFAWLCSEFGDCPRCHGVPLHSRLIKFLSALREAMHSVKPDARLWWEPWEISEGQILSVVEGMESEGFGLILHHTVAEVQFCNTTDGTLRNTARLASRRGIPVMGEGFFSGAGEDIYPMTHLACPRLVYQQLKALAETPGIVGAKEYYGMVPEHFSVNIGMYKAFLQSPASSLNELLGQIVATYPVELQNRLLEAWELTSTAMEVFPWNGSWALRRIFDSSLDRVWQTIPGACWQTPSWQANRKGFFMVTDQQTLSPWMKEDVALRAIQASRIFLEAEAVYADIMQCLSEPNEEITLMAREVQLAQRVSAHFGQSLYEHRSL